MTRAEQLRKDLAARMEDIRTGKLGCDIGSTIARLANIEVKSVMAEIKYSSKRGENTQKINFFEEKI